jgi:Helicase HerA, central domain
MTLGTQVLRFARGSMLQEGFPPIRLFRALIALCDDIGEEHDMLITSIVVWFNAVWRRLPQAYMTDEEGFTRELNQWNENDDYDRGQISVPLYDLVSMGNCIGSIHGHFMYDDSLIDGNIAAELRQQLRRNDASAYGLDPYHRRKTKVPSPEELEWEPQQYIEKFLHHTPFYHFFHTQVPFRIPRETYTRHGFILAPTGFGKSQLLGSMIAEFLSQDNSPGMFVLDPHGNEEKSLYNLLLRRVPASRLEIIDVDEDPPILNFLSMSQGETEIQALQIFNFLMSSLSGDMSDKQGAIVPYLLKLLRRIPDASLETLRLIVDEKVKRPEQSAFASAIASLPNVDQGFFHNQFYNARMQETKDAIGWKLYAAVSSEVFRHMFCSPGGSSINFDRLMAERKVVLVRASKDTLGADGQSVFFQYIIAQYFAAGLRRARIPERDRHLNILFGDEASVWLSSPIIANICFELRKFKCGLWQATQVYEQIGEGVRAAILGSVGTKICGPVQSSDANTLANEMYTTGAFIRSMRAKERSHADWAFYVSGMTDKAVKVRVPYGTLEALPQRPRRRRGPPLSELTTDHELEERFETLMLEEEAKNDFRESPSSPVLSQTHESFQEREPDWILEDMKAAEEKASEATIKPGRDWSEPT